MGKPRMIILIRHAQSEGNKNRDIHQLIPDHRVKLTPEGYTQAEDAGRRLRSMLKPDDSLQFYTSPYRRTRETTEGILRTLTSDDPDQGPSPFPRHKIKVYEEPRLREQDFGNFQPCSAEMERMWQERADYGHFFYRIPYGESAADAYDRVSGFNESLWRQFGEADFPSVCVLVTHGLMTRVFLMKWYHWSVEYFEDLRNVNHCEFIVMKQNQDNGKYILQNRLRTWSDMRRRAAVANGNKAPSPTGSTNHYAIPSRRWGGCADGCDHGKFDMPRRPRRQNTQDFIQQPPAKAETPNEREDHPFAPHEADEAAVTSSGSATRKKSQTSKSTTYSKSTSTDNNGGHRTKPLGSQSVPDSVPSVTLTASAGEEANEGGKDALEDEVASISESSEEADDRRASLSPGDLHLDAQHPQHPPLLFLARGRDAGGSRSGMGSPNDASDDSDYYDTTMQQLATRPAPSAGPTVPRHKNTRSLLSQLSDSDTLPSPSNGDANDHSTSLERQSSTRSRPRTSGSGRRGSRKERSASIKTEEEWAEESGMTGAKKADALGDMDEEPDPNGLEAVSQAELEQIKNSDRKGFGEIY